MEWIIATSIVAVIALVIILWWISTGNSFKRKNVKISEALSGVEVALTNRFDMLTKLLEVAKGFADHERNLFARIVEMRRGMSVGELNKASEQADALASRLFAVAEAYPELRSSEVFRELQAGIRSVEQHLQAARRLYNSNVSAFNSAIIVFPASMVAKSKRLEEKEFFSAEESKRVDVEMKF